MAELEMSFEEAMERLGQCVKILEDGSTSLDDALAVFEEATGLVRFCNERLNSAERRVRILVESQDGAVTDAPFDAEDAD